MSSEAFNKIIKEVNALTPQERRELIDQLTHEEQNFTLREWLTKARDMRPKLPPTSDSVDILRELREVRSKQMKSTEVCVDASLAIKVVVPRLEVIRQMLYSIGGSARTYN